MSARRTIVPMRLALLVPLALAAIAPRADAFTVSGRFLYEDRLYDGNGYTGAVQNLPIRRAKVEVVNLVTQQVHLDDLLAGMTAMEFILRFTFTHPDLHTNIVGTINPVHLQHNVDVLLQGPLPADVYAETRRRLDAVGLVPQGA